MLTLYALHRGPDITNNIFHLLDSMGVIINWQCENKLSWWRTLLSVFPFLCFCINSDISCVFRKALNLQGSTLGMSFLGSAFKMRNVLSLTWALLWECQASVLSFKLRWICEGTHVLHRLHRQFYHRRECKGCNAMQACRPKGTITHRQHDIPTNRVMSFQVWIWTFELNFAILCPCLQVKSSRSLLVLKKLPTTGSSSSSLGSTGTGWRFFSRSLPSSGSPWPASSPPSPPSSWPPTFAASSRSSGQAHFSQGHPCL